MKNNILLAIIAALPAPVLAFQPLITDDTGTQGAGGNQIEAAFNRTVAKAPGTTTVTHAVPLVYTRGITEALDLYAGIGWQKISPGAPAATERGWGNPAFGGKWRFYDNETSKLSFALKPEVQLPVSRERELRGLGQSRTSYSLALIATQETAFGAVHANLALQQVNTADAALAAAARRDRYRLSVAPVWDVADKWKLALDAGLMTNPDRTANARMGYLELGGIYSPDKNLDLAIGVIRNLMDGSADTWQATMGATFRFK